MTQSTDKSKQRLPLPPLSPPPTTPQKNTFLDDEDDDDDFLDKTQVNTDKGIPPLGKPLKSKPLSPPPLTPLKGNAAKSLDDDLDLGDLDDIDLDDLDDNHESNNLTDVTVIPQLDNTKTKVPNLPPPPKAANKAKKSIPGNLPPLPNTRNSTGVTQTRPMGGANLGRPPSAMPGETGVARPPSSGAAGMRAGSPPSYTASRVGRSPGQPSLEELIKLAFDKGFSDVHLGVGELPRMRDRGKMTALDQYPEIDLNTFMSWLREILKEDEIQKFKKELEFDGATQYDFARIRINVFDTLRGPALVLRLIPLTILTMEQLKLPASCRDVSDAHKGLILVTGPTGSGKSTTLAAMVDYINKEHSKHIITIEDPVEFVHKSRNSLVKQREVGQHTLLFDNALKASLREDPDIILVGEMRDKGTVNTALKAAQTGHLVMGTLHTNSAVKTVERILTLYTAEEQPAMRSALAESLVAIIAQGLCRTTDGKRAAYHDILINTETIKEYIKDGKYDEIEPLMEDGEFDGMITMNKSLFNLYQEGRITEETALEQTPTRNQMAMMLRGKI